MTRTGLALVVIVALLVGCGNNVTAEIETSGSSGAIRDSAGSTTCAVTFFSRALERETTYGVLMPARVESGRTYPVLYLLHGAYGSWRDWSDDAAVEAALGGQQLIVVMPDGGAFGWYTDSLTTRADRYETFVTRDLIDDVEKRLPVGRGRESRGICGLSMGGHGALSLAARHPDLYASASSMSGILRIENHPNSWHLMEAFGYPLPAHVDGKLPDFHPPPVTQLVDAWREHSVYALVDRYAKMSEVPALYFDTGTSDTLAVRDNREVHERMTSLGVAHRYAEFPGTHDWKYWNARIGTHLAFHLARFGEFARHTH